MLRYRLEVRVRNPRKSEGSARAARSISVRPEGAASRAGAADFFGDCLCASHRLTVEGSTQGIRERQRRARPLSALAARTCLGQQTIYTKSSTSGLVLTCPLFLNHS